MSWYCDIAPGHPVHGPYHEREYGFPAREDRVLFERLALEIHQAGLSWELVLRRRAAWLGWATRAVMLLNAALLAGLSWRALGGA